MSRSGYSEDFGDDDPLAMGRYRQAVSRAMNGKRGQAFLKEALAALDAMPVKELAAESLVTADGEYCTLGVVGAARGIDLTKLDPEDAAEVASVFNIAESMAREIVFENDEVDYRETPAQRWTRMRAWIAEQIKGASKGEKG